MSTFTIPTIFTAIDKMTAPLRKMAAGVQGIADKSQAFTDRSERAFRRLTPALSSAAKEFLSFASAAAISAAVVGGVMFSVQSLKDYETAVSSFRTIVSDVSDKDFAKYQDKINEVARTTKKSSVETAAAFEKIAGLNSEFAKTADGIGQVSAAAITLSKASGDELGASAESLVGIMNQFNLAAEQSNRTINVLAAGAGVGAASIVNTAESFKNFGSVASGANISLEQSVGLIQTLGKFSVFGAEAGTKLRGSVLKLQQAGVGYASGQFDINNALAEAKEKIDKLRTAKEKDAAVLAMFGAENISTGKILLNNISLFEEYTKGVTGTSEAQKQAEIRSNTLSIKLEEMKAAWVNLITGSDGANSSLETAKRTIGFLTDNLDTIVSVGTKVLLFFAAWKVTIIAARTALLIYNVALGVSSALSSTASIAVGANTTALAAYNFTSKMVTASIWLWTTAQTAINILMTANPIGLIIVGVAALIALIAAIIIKYDEWGAALTFVLGPLGMIINLIQSFRRNWEMITSAFENGGFIAGIKAIGVAIFDMILMPLQQIFELIEKIPGLGDLGWSSAVEGFRKDIGATIETKEEVNPKLAEQNGLVQRLENTNTSNVNLNVNDPNNRTTVQTENLPPNVRIGSTVGG